MVRATQPYRPQFDQQTGAASDGLRAGEDVIGVVDIGTSKVVCLICAVARYAGEDQRPPRILGLGHRQSSGMKASVVTDMDAAEDAVRSAIQQAEAMAGVALERIFLPVACGRLKSNNMKASTEVEGRVVTAQDLDKLAASGRRYVERDGRVLLHLNTIGYRLDGVGGITDPNDLEGRALSCDLHAASADHAPLRNLMQVVERCNLDITGLTPTPYASALAATTPAERRDGVVLVDIGAGSTTMAFFVEGHLVSVHAAPIGGNHLTFDIARALTTPVVEAERIKTLYGTMQAAHSDEHDLVPYKITGDQDSPFLHATKAELRAIIAPRVDALIGMISERIETSSIAPGRFARVVLTGGGSQLVGLADMAADLLDRPLRIGRVDARVGWGRQVGQPIFSTACGAALIASDVRLQSLGLPPSTGAEAGYFGQVGRWFKESF
jgi:cell division protein FtsA